MRVAAEQGQVPGRAGREVVVVRRLRVGREQPGQVGDAPLDQRGQPVVARGHRRRPPQLPGRWCRDRRAAGGRRGHLDGRLPAPAGRQRHLPSGQHPGRGRHPYLLRAGGEGGDHRHPVRDRPAQRAGRLHLRAERPRRAGPAGLHLGHVGQVGVELEADRAAERRAGPGDQADRLAHAARGDRPVPLQEDGRVRTGVAEVPGDADEPGGRGAGGLPAHRHRLAPVHAHDQPGQHPAVGQVESAGAGPGDLTVRVGQRQRGRRDYGHQLVQIGLVVADGRLSRGELDSRHRSRLAI